MPDFLTSEYNAPGVASATTIVAIPQVTHQETTANLADGASIDFDFNIDSNPVFDMFLRADQNLIVRVFVRLSSSDTYTQLGGDYLYVQPNLMNVLSALRVPGSMARIRILNSSGAATTVLAGQVHSRSL